MVRKLPAMTGDDYFGVIMQADQHVELGSQVGPGEAVDEPGGDGGAAQPDPSAAVGSACSARMRSMPSGASAGNRIRRGATTRGRPSSSAANGSTCPRAITAKAGPTCSCSKHRRSSAGPGPRGRRCPRSWPRCRRRGPRTSRPARDGSKSRVVSPDATCRPAAARQEVAIARPALRRSRRGTVMPADPLPDRKSRFARRARRRPAAARDADRPAARPEVAIARRALRRPAVLGRPRSIAAGDRRAARASTCHLHEAQIAQMTSEPASPTS